MFRGIVVVIVLALGLLWLAAPPRKPREASAPQADRLAFLSETFAPLLAPQQTDGSPGNKDEETALEALSNGVQRLRMGDPNGAIEMFEKAAAGGIWEANLGLAEGYREIKEWDRAISILQDVAVEHEKDYRVWLLMGDIFLDKGDLGGAVDAWEIVMTLRPSPELSDRIRTARVEMNLRDRYRNDLSRHFALDFEGPIHDGVVHEVAKALEDAYQSVGLELGRYPDERIGVKLYSRESFYDVTRAPSWAEGVYDGVIRLPVVGADADLETLRRVAVHEYVHAVVTGLAGEAAPSWLQEGLATNMESPSPYVWARGILTADDVVPLTADELGEPFGGLPEESIGLAYAESYMVVQYLMTRFGPYKMQDMLRELGDDEPMEDAMQGAFQIGLQTAIDTAMEEMRRREGPGWQRS